MFRHSQSSFKKTAIRSVTGAAQDPALYALVQAWRSQGHLLSDLDPLGIRRRGEATPELLPASYGLSEEDEREIPCGLLDMGKSRATVQEVLQHLRRSYAGSIGAELSHLPTSEERDWLTQQLESVKPLTPAQRRNAFVTLMKSEAFDHFMQRKFATFKRYGLEGAESMMTVVETVFQRAKELGNDDVVIGMPHRGRLNLLVSLLEFPARALFHKVKGGSLMPAEAPANAQCDVISHVAHSVDLPNQLHVTMLNNPSHLETINAASQGKTRARQDGVGGAEKRAALNLQLHGDAAFAGQGVVHESLLLSQLEHYQCGGTVHVVVNNQIGYTTLPERSRSSRYATDIAKSLAVPVLHVNAEDVEAVAVAARICVDFREKFGRDVVLDLVGYRRHGHNELDEPSFTQPLMYQNIRTRDTLVTRYEKTLIKEGVLKPDQGAKLRKRMDDHLTAELAALEKDGGMEVPEEWHYSGPQWSGIAWKKGEIDSAALVDTGVEQERLQQCGAASIDVPKEVTLHSRLARTHVKARQKLLEQKLADWATAEAMAFGTLLQEGYDVRLSGQDVPRGTFSQRHGVLTCQGSETEFSPLQQSLPDRKGNITYAASPLAEYSVVAFEYGYSLESPKCLAIWEAQFGDFWNTAQVALDTLVSGSDAKWSRQQSLTLLLPHGYDGTGPEHSSSRLERLLQLCDGRDAGNSDVNMTVAFPTTPAQYFHLLRRQMHRPWRRPLCVVGPKTLLRDSRAISTMDEMTPGTCFQSVLDDVTLENKEDAKRVVLCSGKFYYDLVDAVKDTETAVVRIEEIAPWPREALDKVLSQYTSAQELLWVQEEPANQGAWTFAEPRLRALSSLPLRLLSRPALATPAAGFGQMHRAEAAQLLADVETAVAACAE